jgi:hypothetical protein
MGPGAHGRREPRKVERLTMSLGHTIPKIRGRIVGN